MLKKFLLNTISFFLIGISVHTCLANEKYIDLTHSFDSNTLNWPTANPFKLIKDFAGTAPRGYFYAINDYASAEHVGTHVDAPLHFAKGHKGVSEISLNDLIGPAIMVNVQQKTAHDKDYQISIADFRAWENKYGKINPHTIILLNTGFANYWPNRKNYMGTAKLGAEALNKMHFPGLSEEAAKWLVSNRNVKAIGIDTASMDYGQSQDFLTHQFLTAHNIPFFENVAHLDALTPKGFRVYALPMKIKGGTGAPLRIIAEIEGKKQR